MRISSVLLWLTLVHSLSSKYYEALASLVPYPQQQTLRTAANPHTAFVGTQDAPHLFAGEFSTVEELCEALFDDVEELRNFDVNLPHEYHKQEEYEEAMEMPVYALTEQLVAHAWIKLFRIHQKYIQIFDILERLSEKDYTAIFDHINEKFYYPGTDKKEPEFYLDDQSFDVATMSYDVLDGKICKMLEDIQAQFGVDVITAQEIRAFAEIPFVSVDEDTEIVDVELMINLPDGELSPQGLTILKLIVKIPLLIIKIILIIIWNLIELKKLIELAEAKAILLIFRLLKKICRIIRFLKMQIVFEIRSILWTIKSGKPLYKAMSVIFLIIKKLRQLAWILRDTLYRYRWKVYFLLKKVSTVPLALVLYLKEVVFDKLGIPVEKLLEYGPWCEAEEKYPDGKYFQTFSRYKYWGPSTSPLPFDVLKDYLKEAGVEYDIQDIYDLAWEELKQDNLDAKETESGNIIFNMNEEYGFNSVKLDIKKLQDDQKSDKNKLDKSYWDGSFDHRLTDTTKKIPGNKKAVRPSKRPHAATKTSKHTTK